MPHTSPEYVFLPKNNFLLPTELKKGKLINMGGNEGKGSYVY